MNRPKRKAMPCPKCGGRCFRPNICLACAKRAGETSIELVGDVKQQAIDEFMFWYAAHPGAWERAQSGLMMAVPRDDATACWP